jgi:hypothetical protein
MTLAASHTDRYFPSTSIVGKGMLPIGWREDIVLRTPLDEAVTCGRLPGLVSPCDKRPLNSKPFFVRNRSVPDTRCTATGFTWGEVMSSITKNLPLLKISEPCPSPLCFPMPGSFRSRTADITTCHQMPQPTGYFCQKRVCAKGCGGFHLQIP